tara:strand:- start:125 stop:367 length:243 start_codon:yes stop_codon:yes gene_type:complete
MYKGNKSIIPDFSKMEIAELNARLNTINKALERLNSHMRLPVSFQEGGYLLLKNQITVEITRRTSIEVTHEALASSSTAP